MDTKRLEQIGETLVVSTLLESGILVSKPWFDQRGADLIGFTSVDDRGRFCRIQCKYRELKSRTSVIVSSDYVTGAFVLFLYLKMLDSRHLFCFLPKDIASHFRKGKLGRNAAFRLTITPKTASALMKNKSLAFTPKRGSEIIALMRTSSPDFEIRRAFLGVVKATRTVQRIRAERDRLQQLIHEIEIARLSKKGPEDTLEVLQEYMAYVESQEPELKGGNTSI